MERLQLMEQASKVKNLSFLASNEAEAQAHVRRLCECASESAKTHLCLANYGRSLSTDDGHKLQNTKASRLPQQQEGKGYLLKVADFRIRNFF